MNWKQGEDVIIAGSVSNDQAREIFGSWKEPKPYIRIVPQPLYGDFGADDMGKVPGVRRRRTGSQGEVVIRYCAAWPPRPKRPMSPPAMRWASTPAGRCRARVILPAAAVVP